MSDSDGESSSDPPLGRVLAGRRHQARGPPRTSSTHSLPSRPAENLPTKRTSAPPRGLGDFHWRALYCSWSASRKGGRQ